MSDPKGSAHVVCGKMSDPKGSAHVVCGNDYGEIAEDGFSRMLERADIGAWRKLRMESEAGVYPVLNRGPRTGSACCMLH